MPTILLYLFDGTAIPVSYTHLQNQNLLCYHYTIVQSHRLVSRCKGRAKIPDYKILNEEIVTLLGGRVAEKLVLEDISTVVRSAATLSSAIRV